MKKFSRKNALLLLAAGTLIIAVSQVAVHYSPEFPDFAKGALSGIGIGILILAVFFGDFKTAK
ncbi:hypothetical protein [Kaistella palustris]|uniref:hypothetical protein n=1 Tax=Kaistella palustris TaxID=493376 RepID=UPI0012EBA383|nr:hypothetical protein [Kaistella palustris]